MSTTLHRDRRHDQLAAAPTTPAQRAQHARRMTVAVAVAIVLAAATTVIILISQPATVDVPTGSRAGVTTRAVDEDEALRRLIARGYVPLAAAAVDSDNVVTADLYTPEERATLQQVRAGLLPDGLLDAEPYVTKRLINQGLIPAGSVR